MGTSYCCCYIVAALLLSAVWVSGGDDQVYVKPEFEDILKKMKVS